MGYTYALESCDNGRIKKLNTLTNLDTFWEDVKVLTHKVTSCHAINRWQILADVRYRELLREKEENNAA